MNKIFEYKYLFILGIIIALLQVAILYNFYFYNKHNQSIEIINNNSEYVVGINVKQIKRQDSSSFWNPFYNYNTYEVDNLGSGLIYSADGYIITNAHVVSNAHKIDVTLIGGKTYEAKIIGLDELTDLALIKIEVENLNAAKLGNSDLLMVGQNIVALGNPLGLFNVSHQPTATSGIISGINVDFGLKNNVYVYQDMIQTDASINPGNSGGPLIDIKGDVIGINTFIMTGSDYQSGSIGIGFAIPINRVKEIISDIIKYGEVKRSYTTGIHIQDVNKFTQQYLRLSDPNGVLITDIEKRSSGELAGLKVGDVILKLDNYKIINGNDVVRAINEGLHKVGDTIKILVWRPSSGQELELDLELEEAKSKTWGFK